MDRSPPNAEFYEHVERWTPVGLPRTRAAREFVKSLGFHRLLDLGSGDGENAESLAAVGSGAVVCVDVAEVAVQACRARGFEAHLADIDQGPLPLPSGSFDLVHMTEVIEHLIHPDRVLAEVHRVLSPQGHLVISTPNLACLPNRVLLPLGVQPIFTEVSERLVLGRRLHALGQGGKPVGHLRLYTRRALIEVLSLNGFDVVQVRGVAMHERGPAAFAERIASLVPGWAMIWVILAKARCQ